MTVVDRAADVIERGHDLAAVSHLIPAGVWTEPLVALVAALHAHTAATLPAEDRAGTSVAEEGTHNASDAGSIPAPPTIPCPHCGGSGRLYDVDPVGEPCGVCREDGFIRFDDA